MRPTLLLAAAALALAVNGPARADDAAQREADMFGPSSDAKPDEKKPDDKKAGDKKAGDAKTRENTGKPTIDDAQKREDDMFGSSPVQAEQPQPEARDEKQPELAPVDTNALYQAAEETNNKLAIGGRLFNQDQISHTEGQALRAATLSLPTLLDVYLDGRPNDRLRVYARGRVSSDASQIDGKPAAFGTGTQQSLTTSLDQLWLKWDAYHKVFFTLGRQRIKWGAGRFWNPTDFLNAQRLNALALVDTRLGTTLFKAHVPVESLGWNFYAIANMTGAARPDDAGFALRGEFVLGPAEIALSSQVRRANTPGSTIAAAQAPEANRGNLLLNLPTPDPSIGTQLQLGADVSAGVGPFDLHVEAALTHGNKSLFFTEAVTVQDIGRAAVTPNGNAPLPAEFRDDRWIPQVVAGGDVSIKYSDEDSLNLGAEYFFNDAGVPDDSFYQGLLATGNFVPFYLGRHYLALSASFINPGTWNNTSFILSNLSNLSDGSNLARFDYSLVALTNLTFRAFVNYHYGSSGEFKFGGAFTGLPTGTTAAQTAVLKPTLVDAGIGFILNI